MGAELVKQAAVKQNETAGDGTTTTTCLAQALYSDSVSLLDEGEIAPKIKKEMELVSSKIIEKLDAMRVDVTEEDYYKIAFVSSNGDHEIADMVSTAWKQVGVDGYVSAAVSKRQTTSVHTSDGYLAEGYVPNPLFLTSHDKGLAEYDNPVILLLSNVNKLSLGRLKPVFDYWGEHVQDQPLVIFGRGLDDNVLSMLYSNRRERGTRVLPVIAKDSFDHEDFEDLSFYLGCEVFSDSNLDFKKALESGVLFGTAEKVSYRGGRLSITPREDHEFSPQYIDRLESLRDLVANSATSQEEKEYVSKRLGRMNGGIATIAVGGQTESEAKERKDRFDDAIYAVKSTFNSGVLPGGGAALYTAFEKVIEELPGTNFTWCFTEPFFTLMANAGVDTNNIDDRTRPFNTETLEYDDNIIDSAKVVIDAVKDATSVAVMLTMIDTAVTFNNEALESFKSSVVNGG